MRAISNKASRDATEERPAGHSLDLQTVKRLLAYTQPHSGKRTACFSLTTVRSLQQPALAWALAAIINGPISRGDFRGTVIDSLWFAALVLFTALIFHFR